ncbi:MAG TPA: SDR family oxidoreductase [Phenylobacterium sp.]|jgi:NAD(P)-dependent dehydrogenase (short-subunit alcohol dehydrogenase family)
MGISPLNGQHVVIIGGSSGIGFAVAEAALAEGARVTIGSSDPAKVEAALARLGAGASGGAVDLRDTASVAAFADSLSGIDHLVSTAGDWGGAFRGAGLANMDLTEAAQGLEVRFWGPLRAIQAALPKLSASGSITLTGGVRTHRPSKGMPLSSAFGGAIEHLAKGLAVDLAPIRVNAVCPGIILTDVWANVPEDRIAAMTSRLPLPRGGTPAETAEAYIHLMRATYTTGQVLVVDGGVMLV